MMRIALLVVSLLLAPAAAAGQATFVVRHAERADAGMASGPKADPELSAAGRARAESLSSLLRDAGITRIYVSEFRRTRQTAEPLAKAAGVEVTTVSGRDVQSLIAQLKAGKGNALIVGHSNTVPEILKALGVVDAVVIGDDEHDNLFVVAGGTFVRLRYR